MLPDKQHSWAESDFTIYWAAGYNLSSGLWLVEAFEMRQCPVSSSDPVSISQKSFSEGFTDLTIPKSVTNLRALSNLWHRAMSTM